MTDEPLTLHILTGALGSGKTTILNRLLKSTSFVDVLVLVNEFGSIPVDHDIIEQVSEDVIVLASGCVCCSVSGDLHEALGRLVDLRLGGQWRYANHLFLETTGLADPVPILQLVSNDEVLRRYVQIGQVITVMDALRNYADGDMQPLHANQIAQADLLLLSKSDLASVADQSRTQALVAALNPDCVIMDVGQHGASIEALVSRILKPGPKRFTTCSPAPALAGICTVAIEVARPMAQERFALWLQLLMQSTGERLLRVKGHIPFHSGDAFIHGVGSVMHRPDIVPFREGQSGTLVLIGRQLNAASLQRSFDFVTTDKVSLPPSFHARCYETQAIAFESCVLSNVVAKARGLLPATQVEATHPSLHWGPHNPWSLAGQAFDAWGLLSLAERGPLAAKASQILGADLHLIGMELLTPQTHWLVPTSSGILADEARYLPTDPRQCVSFIIPLKGEPRRGAPQAITWSKLSDPLVLSDDHSWRALVVTYGNALAGWDRSFNHPANILRDLDRPLESAVSQPLWHLSGRKHAAANYAIGFNRPRAAWLT